MRESRMINRDSFGGKSRGALKSILKNKVSWWREWCYIEFYFQKLVMEVEIDLVDWLRLLGGDCRRAVYAFDFINIINRNSSAK